MSLPGLKNPLFVAMDVDSAEEAFRIASLLEGLVGGIKVGPRLVLPHGRSLMTELARIAPVFIDCKFYDIPSTMEHAVRAAFEMGATYVTVHASSGRKALERMAEIEKELRAHRPFTILAVTVLTSFSVDQLNDIGWTQSVDAHVSQLAGLTAASGLSTVVCSPHELESLKKQYPTLKYVVPGIRFEDGAKDDQSRTMTPLQAMKAGANALVVGRPILHADEPALAAEKLLLSLEGRS